jgi:hypothetical protein
MATVVPSDVVDEVLGAWGIAVEYDHCGTVL